MGWDTLCLTLFIIVVIYMESMIENNEIRPGMLVKSSQTGWGFVVERDGALHVVCCAVPLTWPLEGCNINAIYTTQHFAGEDIIGGGGHA